MPALLRPAIGLAIGIAVAMPALAQEADYPNRTVTIVAPAAPGGLYSLFARLIGSKLEQRLGQTFIVENRPGASSIVGAMSVLRGAHDGYTLIVMNNTGMAVNVTLQKSLPYDPVKDFAPIALIAQIPEVLVVNAALPVHTLDDLARLARETPGGLSYGSAGAGTGLHLSGVVLGSMLGVPFIHVPYKGAQPAIADVAGGHTAFMFSPIPFAIPLAQAGKVRMLAVNSAARVEALPDVPTLAEIGVTKFDIVSWFMLVAPAGTPAGVVEKLGREVGAITGDPQVRRELAGLGLAPVRSPPPGALKHFIADEITRWGAVVKQAGLAGLQ